MSAGSAGSGWFDGEVSGRRQPDRARSAHRSQFTLNGAAVAHGEPNPHAGAGPHHRLTHKLHHAESARTEFGGQRPVTAPGGPPPSAHYQGMTDAAGRPTHFHRAPRGERVLSPEVGNWGVPQQERLTAGWKEEAVTSPTSHEQYQTYFEIQDGAQEKEAAGVTSTFYRPERGERMLQRNTLPSPHIYHEAISTTPAERPNGDVTAWDIRQGGAQPPAPLHSEDRPAGLRSHEEAVRARPSKGERVVQLPQHVDHNPHLDQVN
eukprot:gene16341-32471_t